MSSFEYIRDFSLSRFHSSLFFSEDEQFTNTRQSFSSTRWIFLLRAKQRNLDPCTRGLSFHIQIDLISRAQRDMTCTLRKKPVVYRGHDSAQQWMEIWRCYRGRTDLIYACAWTVRVCVQSMYPDLSIDRIAMLQLTSIRLPHVNFNPVFRFCSPARRLTQLHAQKAAKA